MATSIKPAATSTTKADNATGTTDVKVTPKRQVTYIFNATVSTPPNIPYAVAVNGSALPIYATKPARVSGKGGKITVTVDAGSKVSLFLNSDAHPLYRKNAVYEITANERDVQVTITEKSGKHSDADTPVLKAQANGAAASAVDAYQASLTGDIWMKVSHAYTSAEVDALVPAGTSAESLAAVKCIYDGLTIKKLSIAVPATGDKQALTLTVSFNDSDNPKSNIVSYGLLADGLPRVHPAGYAALFNAAIENSISSLNVTSCWRPMLGSIAHRAGLGLDVDYVGKTHMNRQELRLNQSTGKGNGDDTDNVSDAEVKRFKEYEAAIVANKKAQADLIAATNAAKAARSDPVTRLEALTKQEAAQETAVKSAITEATALDRWSNERNANEPATVRLFRSSLLKCACVAQLFDPWMMDSDARDGQALTPNMQRGAATSNERLHSHHLHVTVRDPKIL